MIIKILEISIYISSSSKFVINDTQPMLCHRTIASHKTYPYQNNWTSKCTMLREVYVRVYYHKNSTFKTLIMILAKGPKRKVWNLPTFSSLSDTSIQINVFLETMVWDKFSSTWKVWGNIKISFCISIKKAINNMKVSFFFFLIKKLKSIISNLSLYSLT